MDWTTLFSMQQTLDHHIKTKHRLTDKNLLEERHLALLVELGELANETRCFKFWSTKPASDTAAILEEYVDGIHFILSLGLESGYSYNKALEDQVNGSLTEQFNEVFNKCITFRNDPTQINYEILFTTYLQLGVMLGFSEEDIQTAYVKKNEVNFKRQHQGY